MKDLKVSCLVESDRIVAHENAHFSYGNYETKSSNLADENAKRFHKRNTASEV